MIAASLQGNYIGEIDTINLSGNKDCIKISDFVVLIWKLNELQFVSHNSLTTISHYLKFLGNHVEPQPL